MKKKIPVLNYEAEFDSDKSSNQFMAGRTLEPTFSNYRYKQEAINIVAEALFSQHKEHYKFNHQFTVANDLDQLEAFMKQPERDQNQVFIIYNVDGQHWVVFCVTIVGKKCYVLYKDSFGKPVPLDVKEIVNKYSGNVRFKSHPGQEQKDDLSCDPFFLKNLEIMLESLKSEPNDFMLDFENSKFCGQTEIEEHKNRFKKILQMQSLAQTPVSKITMESLQLYNIKLTAEEVKFLDTDRWFEQKIIHAAAQSLFSQFHEQYNCPQKFNVSENMDQLECCLKDLKSDHDDVYIIYNKGRNHWVVFCVTRMSKKKYVLYKDAFGKQVPTDVVNIIKEHLDNVSIKSHPGNEQQDDFCNGSVMALKNLEIMLQCMHFYAAEFVVDFEKTSFCSQGEVRYAKKSFKSMINKQLTGSPANINSGQEAGLVEQDVLLDSDHWYSQADIAVIAENLFSVHNGYYTFAHQFEVVGSLDQLKCFLESPQRNHKLAFVIYNEGGNHWVLSCLFRLDTKTYVLYKDSFGNPIPIDVKEIIIANEVSVIFKNHPGPEQVDKLSCGPMSLKNLEIMLHFIEKNPIDFIFQFEKIQFCSQVEIEEAKYQYKFVLKKHMAEQRPTVQNVFENVSHQLYSLEEIYAVAETLFRQYHEQYNFSHQFKVLNDLDELKDFIKILGSNHSPVFIMYNEGAGHWVVFCIFRVVLKSYILYKNSMGKPVPDVIENIFREYFNNVTFENHLGREQQDSVSCGPIALKNLEIMLEYFQADPIGFVHEFEKIKFCSQDEVDNVRISFNSKNNKEEKFLVGQVMQTNSDHLYSQAEIATIAENLFSVHNGYYTFAHQFEVVGSLDHLKCFLKKPDRDQRLAFVIYNEGGSHWVLFCMIRGHKSFDVLFKDSCGKPIATEVQDLITVHEPDVSFKNHVGSEQKDFTSCGPMSLKNLEIMLEGIKINRADFIENFEKTQFCGNNLLSKIKIWFKTLMNQRKENAIDKYIKDLIDDPKFNEFKVEMNHHITSGPAYLEIVPAFNEFRHFQEVELEKNKNNQDYIPNEAAIKEKREIFKKKLYEINTEYPIQNTKIGSIDTAITEKFSKQIEKFHKLLDAQSLCDDKNESISSLELISHKVGIDKDILQQYLDIRSIPEYQEANLNNMDSQIPVATLCKNEIENQLLALKKHKLPQNPGQNAGKTLETVLSELHPREIINQLKTEYEQVMNAYEKWKTADFEKILSWTTRKKRNLNDAQIIEAIAVMDRANEIVTMGHRLRIPQILSVLVFLRGDGKEGQLCQIQTGEGKTTIVSLVATLKVLQGNRVDIITSNQVLASEALKTRELFYALFGISVATNNIDETYKTGRRACYTADVVYGSIGNFQFDHLRDSFEGLETRGGRRFDFVILDEVDSLLIDNGGHIAKLASPFPGMEALKYIYIKIWQELHKAGSDTESEFEKRSEEEIAKLTKQFQDQVQVNQKFEEFKKEMLNTTRDKLKARIKGTNPTDIELIPMHLKKYASFMIDKWIDNAIYAKYECNEYEQYVLKEKDGESVIVPVDYKNTGVTLRNTIWSNGLHQFVQLKHNLHLTAETLTTSFISNVGYIKLYESSNIFGLTGTLGSTAEQYLLSSAYSVSFSKIPTYMPKKFQEIEGCVVDDAKWVRTVAAKSSEIALHGRSVLIICKTIKDLQDVEKTIQELQMYNKFKNLKISTYPDEDSSEIVEQVIDQREIIISTNIAGRGTDFKTSKALEEHGGLHVCVSFLPVNKRVEDQAFGRTARQENSGTAQLIIRKSELEDIQESCEVDFSRVKDKRDYIEKVRLEKIRTEELVVIGFQDSLFKAFSKFYKGIQDSISYDPRQLYLAKDLKEHWAFWFNGKGYTHSLINGTTVDREFKDFQNSAKAIIDGKISHNPYYSVCEAELYLNKSSINKAKDALHHALELAGENSHLMYSAHFKLFEVAIEQGGAFWKCMKNVLKDMLPMMFDKQIFEDLMYKQNAVSALKSAFEALQTEINYIENQILRDTDFIHIILSGLENNLLVKHITSRLLSLTYFRQSIQCLLKDIEDIPKNHELLIQSRVPNYLKALASKDEIFNSSITEAEITELASIGMETTYLLTEVQDIPTELVSAVQLQILLGLGAYAAGVFFPPLFPIAGTLISEAIFDIAMVILKQGKSEFNCWEFAKSKCITYGTAIVTFGITAISASMKILKNILKVCKYLTDALEKYPRLQSILINITKHLEDIYKILKEIWNSIHFIKNVGTDEHFQRVLAYSTTVSQTLISYGVNNHFAKFLKYPSHEETSDSEPNDKD